MHSLPRVFSLNQKSPSSPEAPPASARPSPAVSATPARACSSPIVVRPGDGFDFHETDVSREADVAAMLDAARERFGQVDILVNNAGIQPLGVGFEDLTGPLLERTFAVNVHGVAFGIKHAARVLSDRGRVINMASFVGMIATPGAAAYASLEGGGDSSDPTRRHRTRAAPHHRERRQSRHDPHPGGHWHPR